MSSVSSFWNLVWSSQLQNGLFVGLFDFFIVWWGGDRTILVSCQLQSSWLKVISLFQEYQSKGLNRIVVDQACLQGAASPEELVKRLGGSRVITKILIANNGIAAVSWISLEFLWKAKFCLFRWNASEISSDGATRTSDQRESWGWDFAFAFLWYFFAKIRISTQSWVCVTR